MIVAQPIEAMTALTPISLIAVASSTPLWIHVLAVKGQRHVAYAVVDDHSPGPGLPRPLHYLNAA